MRDANALRYVQNGTLNFVLLKPIDSQLRLLAHHLSPPEDCPASCRGLAGGAGEATSAQCR